MSLSNHFPISNQKNGIDIDNIIFPSNRTDSQEEYHLNRRLSRDVQLLKSQYFIFEDELLNTFDFVFPTRSQLNVFSPKYAIIINGACNLYETISRIVYNQIYDETDINIFNYLSLDNLLNFNNIIIDCPMLIGEFSNTDILKPFDELKWNKTRAIMQSDIPKWWTAYNKIKHNPSEFESYATMENAIRSIAAVAILMYKTYGSGTILGSFMKVERLPDNSKINYLLNVRLSRLFETDGGRFGFTV